MKTWINNKIVDDKDAKVSAFDRGFLYGDGVFETMRGYKGKPAFIDEHLDRLYCSLKRLDIKIPYSKNFLKKEINRLIKINRLADTYARVTVTRGEGRIGFTSTDLGRPTVFIMANRFNPYPKKMYQNGVRIMISKTRQNENSPLSGIKSTSFANYILARLEAQSAGFDDALLLNSKGEVCEASVSNIFLVKGRRLITPHLKSGILPGITRKAVLKLGRDAGLKPLERPVYPRQLYAADEVFLTNSLMEVMPVVRIGAKVTGNGKPGAFTKKLHSAYKKMCL